MCTLAIYFRVFPDYPVVVAANRDEYLDRAALPPTSLGERPRIIGGKDLRAIGTWLGINEHGLVAGLLNRRISETEPNDGKVALARAAVPRRVATTERGGSIALRGESACAGLQRIQPADGVAG